MSDITSKDDELRNKLIESIEDTFVHTLEVRIDEDVSSLADDIMVLIKQYGIQERIDALEQLRSNNNYGFERLDLVVEYQDGTDSGVLPYRKAWNKAYKQFEVTLDAELTALKDKENE